MYVTGKGGHTVREQIANIATEAALVLVASVVGMTLAVGVVWVLLWTFGLKGGAGL